MGAFLLLEMVKTLTFLGEKAHHFKISNQSHRLGEYVPKFSSMF